MLKSGEICSFVDDDAACYLVLCLTEFDKRGSTLRELNFKTSARLLTLPPEVM